MSKKKTKTKTAKDFIQKHQLGTGHAGRGYKLKPEVLALVDEINAERLAGASISLRGFAAALKREFDLPIGYQQIERKIKDHIGRNTW